MTRREELEVMSEFELNKLIAGDAYCVNEDSFGDGGVFVNEGLKYVNYCNNPADIMPLAIENRITLTANPFGDWGAHYCNTHSNNENPYRALAIVLILIKESEL